MAFTIVGVQKTTGRSRQTPKLFISEEYFANKCDDSGNVLPAEDWQHPRPEDLRYCRLGTLVTDKRAWDLIKIVLRLGTGQLKGCARIIETDQDSWLRSRTETWNKRAERERQRRAEHDRQEKEAREPVYAFCPRCGATTESCKNPHHRGLHPCIKCGGGIGNRELRYCSNCLDLPWREQRERAVGHQIVYLTEE